MYSSDVTGVEIRGYDSSAVFSRSFLRSAKILLQNGATLRNTLRMLNRQIPSVGNAVQSRKQCELVRRELEIRCSIRLSYGRRYFEVVQRPRVCIIEADR